MSTPLPLPDAAFHADFPPAAPHVRERDLPHGERMANRRARQLARVPGFTAMPNRRVDRLAQEALEAGEARGLEGEALRRFALDRVRGALPAAGFARVLRAPGPSKSDSPVYRKVAGAAHGGGSAG